MRPIAAILAALTLAACGAGPIDFPASRESGVSPYAVFSQPLQFIGPTPVRVVR